MISKGPKSYSYQQEISTYYSFSHRQSTACQTFPIIKKFGQTHVLGRRRQTYIHILWPTHLLRFGQINQHRFRHKREGIRIKECMILHQYSKRPPLCHKVFGPTPRVRHSLQCNKTIIRYWHKKQCLLGGLNGHTKKKND